MPLQPLLEHAPLVLIGRSEAHGLQLLYAVI